MSTPSPSPLAANANAANNGGGSASSSSSPKPFAGFSFGGGASKSPATATGTGTKGEASPAKANPFSGFSFTKKSATPTTSAMSLFPKSSTAKVPIASKKKQESLKLAEGFANDLDKHKSERKDLKAPMEQYLRTYIGLIDVEKATLTSSTAPVTATTKTKAATVASVPKVVEKPAAPLNFSFGSSTPATSASNSNSAAPLFPPSSSAPKVEFSFAKKSPPAPASAPPTGGFSFGAPAATAKTTSGGATGGGFSFGGVTATGVSAPSSLTSPPSADNNVAEEEDKAEPSTTGESVDVDWDVVEEYSVKACRTSEKKLVKFAEGPVKLQKHKTNDTCRMVMRNAAGKVSLNLAISKNMAFHKNESERKGKSPLCRVIFMGVEDATKGPETFQLVCTKEDLDKLHGKLQELAS